MPGHVSNLLHMSHYIEGLKCMVVPRGKTDQSDDNDAVGPDLVTEFQSILCALYDRDFF